MDCVFCKIAAGEIPSTAVYQDELAYAFGDISPKAPVHVLIIPREHIGSLAEAGADKRALLGHLMGVAGKIARQTHAGETSRPSTGSTFVPTFELATDTLFLNTQLV